MKILDFFRRSVLHDSNHLSLPADEEPVNGEMFGLERLQSYAIELASAHKVQPRASIKRSLLVRLEDNSRQLTSVYQALSQSLQFDRQLTPAAEWLMDNLHIVDEQLREVREDLPKSYYKELPKLSSGPFSGYPRIYHIAIEIISHTDNRLDKPKLSTFLDAYQTHSPLTIGELWAFPISLRLALIENLRRFAVVTLRSLKDRKAAAQVANRWAQVSDETFSDEVASLSRTIGRLLGEKKHSPTFLVELGKQLHDGSRFMSFALETVRSSLVRHGETLEHLTHREHSRQAASQVSIANIITSMRLLSTLDWQDFVESVSLVDRILNRDPTGSYKAMDFQTRDRYRHQIERIAKKTRSSEIDIANRTVEMASEALQNTGGKESPQQAHVGFFLITQEGLQELESKFNYSPSFKELIPRFLLRHPTASYLSFIVLLTLSVIAAFSFLALSRHYSPSKPITWLFIFVTAIPASEIAVLLTNRLINLILQPQHLPKMEFRNGIPKTARTIVVIPTLLSSGDVIEELCSRLEIYYLANRDSQLYFALLGDLPDAATETTASDRKLRRTAQSRIAELNERYSREGSRQRFFFFSRKRIWSDGEGKWICRERKRGNLQAFNRLLRGNRGTEFEIPERPNFRLLNTIRYVITLDADSQLPRDAAHKLVGTIEHPLNRPYFDASKKKVTQGYGILQPRIEIDLVSGLQTSFTRIFSNAKGFDPYTTAVSDVYQDLFHEGNFVGKGLYDVNVFLDTLDGRIPENRLLSHDLFEGLFARTALLTDIALYDDYPLTYESFFERLKRWTRGDWQIASWIFPFVPEETGRSIRNDLSLISRWKIIDNLRRSLVAPALLLCLGIGWLSDLALLAASMTVFVLTILGLPLLLRILSLRIFGAKNSKSEVTTPPDDIWATILQSALRIVFLGSMAVGICDAIIRAIYRQTISKKHLQQWVTAAQADRESKARLSHYFAFMAASPIVALAGAASILLFASPAIIFAGPFLMLWLIAPAIAYYLSKPIQTRVVEELDLKDTDWLRLIARRTWRYFETFAGQSDHWLPPDNFQEEPAEVVAHRTSPTNIGLFLLATTAAHDFGFLGTLETVERIELTCSTLERLARLNGHFFNWYDTHTLEPLNPQYISTVDSGNLAGHLIAVAQACREMIKAPIFDTRTTTGLLDTLKFLRAESESLGKGKRAPGSLVNILVSEIDNCEKILRTASLRKVENWKVLLDQLTSHSMRISHSIATLDQTNDKFHEVAFWALTFKELIGNFQRDLETLSPLQATPDVIKRAAEAERSFITRLENIAGFCTTLADEMDFKFLYDDERKVLTIGYRPADGARDNSYYDLLASEARLASFIAVATGDVDQEHWFRLGRNIVSADGGMALVSWSGTMFEYLMPQLVMREFPRTLLSETSASVVQSQIDYGLKHNVPWGVSESAYNARDLQLNYQYGPFGVPGLGLKRGLAEDLVVSPYATVLAAYLRPSDAVVNLRRLVKADMLGKYGFYEALDYTKDRVPPGQTSAKINAYMTHHQGMIIVALDNLLNDLVIQKRFHNEPTIESAELLLQERVPRQISTVTQPRAAEIVSGGKSKALIAPVPRRYRTAEYFSPQVCLLSNGSYTTMLTTAGSGYSRKNEIAITRWREDAVRDNWGQFFYVRDLRSGALWSSGFQPTLRDPQEYEAVFTENKAGFRRRDAGILTHTEVVVSSEDDAELRRITLVNESTRPREIELTSYAEIVLNPQPADEAHKAFANLFIETDFVREKNAIIARRRPRSPQEEELYCVHVVSVAGELTQDIVAGRDRIAFLGRGGTTQNPDAILHANGHTIDRPSLDPVFSLCVRLLIKPGDSVSAVFSTILTSSRAKTIDLTDKYCSPEAFERSAKLAWTRSQVELRHLGVTFDEANLFQVLAGHLIFANGTLRPNPDILRQNSARQSDLWKFGISGDLPILLLRFSPTTDDFRVLRQLIRAHEYLRVKGINFDLVVLNEQPVTYSETFGEELQALLRLSGAPTKFGQRGGVFLLRGEITSEEDRIGLQTAARVCLQTDRGSLKQQLTRKIKEESFPPQFVRHEIPRSYKKVEREPLEMIFSNGFGGFSAEGKEYYINLETAENLPPAPWANVICNEEGFGFLVTEAGLGCTWSKNSHENRLTTWSNDPVSDPPSECIYLRDELTGSLWSPTPLPIREKLPYSIRHGQGYSIFEHASHGIEQELLVFAPVEESLKILRLRLKNNSGRPRRLSATYFCDLVLGVDRERSMPFIVTDIDPVTGSILARNAHNNEFASRVAFLATNAPSRSWTCDRREFFGRHGNPARPAALLRASLSGKMGAGLDTCAAVQTIVDFEPDETKEMIFLLGEEDSLEKAQAAIERYRLLNVAENEFQKVRASWNEILDTIQINTPDPASNVWMNRWLIYQDLSCRYWGRTSLYQSSGAFGFRDQLQDVMALIYTLPALARSHILHAAARQFKEGDVQHWWHEPSGKGTRTRSSDDLLWLPFVTAFYLEITMDDSILAEIIPFVDAPPLAENQDEAYLEPVVSDERASLYEHCIRAIEHSSKTGKHGLPLIGSGDWSDGMTHVGNLGKGESVWLGWFLAKILDDFTKICRKRGDEGRAQNYRKYFRTLKKNLDSFAWDGNWYLRAFFDDGSPLGSHQNDECRIDAIAQSWSVISGAGSEERSRRAMLSVMEYLVKKQNRMSLLLAPPFDKTTLDPGYIKAYQPGVRENGGQYTHASAWNVIAFALLGEGDRAFELFGYMNPINHTLTEGDLNLYRTEPYAVAADIYAGEFLGRGGWTWYTGAAGWIYRAMLEYILGFKKRGNKLYIEPCIPRDWDTFGIDYKFGTSLYRITVSNPESVSNGVRSVEIDGELTRKNHIPLLADAKTRQVRVTLGQQDFTQMGDRTFTHADPA